MCRAYLQDHYLKFNHLSVSFDFLQPIRIGSEAQRQTHASSPEGFHSIGVGTLKNNVFVKDNYMIRFVRLTCLNNPVDDLIATTFSPFIH